MVFQDASFRVIFMATFCSISDGRAGALVWVCKCCALQTSAHPEPDCAQWELCKEHMAGLIYPLLICQPNHTSNQRLDNSMEVR